MKKFFTEQVWPLAALGALLVAALGVLLLFWQAHRYTEVETEPKSTRISASILTLSDRSEKDIQLFVQKEPHVLGASAVDIDLVKNKRHTTYFYSENPEFTQIWENFLKRRKTFPDVFSTGASQNTRVTNIINGNFDCAEFKNTLSYLYYPEAEPIVKYICSISVPAGFDGSGDFVGYLNFFMDVNPNDQEKKRLAKETIELSTAIYRRDIEQQIKK